jgi:hypothetical protein
MAMADLDPVTNAIRRLKRAASAGQPLARRVSSSTSVLIRL